MDIDEAREKVRERVDNLPKSVWDCERCGESDSMKIRRSSLNQTFHADDCSLKCQNCWYFTTHGIPMPPHDFAIEMELRGGKRVLDFVLDGPEKSVDENLKALGYIP